MSTTTFNFHRRIYSINKYPLTYSILLQNLQRRISDGSKYIKYFQILIFILLGLYFFTLLFFQTPVHLNNAIFGPYHMNLQEFTQHVKNFAEDRQSWFFNRIEYIQVEFGEGNIQNPAGTDKTIRRYSDPRKRDRHIATYKKLSFPKIFIKLPTRFIAHFHSKLPFDFSQFSNFTINCISTVLQQKTAPLKSPQTFLNQSIAIEYIESEYAKNSTAFNMAVLTKCGILIGYLYKPQYEKAFLPTKDYKFSAKDIAFDATRPYFPTFLLYLFLAIFCCLIFPSLYCLFRFGFNQIRIKFLEKYGLLSSPEFQVNENIKEELWVLNLPGTIDDQLLQLDELIQRTEHYYSKMKIIKHPDNGRLYVVLFAVNLSEIKDYKNLPFIICPVSDIQHISLEGIYFINDRNVSTCLQWPLKRSLGVEKEEYAQWLHDKLMEISEDYRHQFQNLVRPQNIHVYLREWNLGDDEFDESAVEFLKFILEEKNIRRYKSQRQLWMHPFKPDDIPASEIYIASFRFREQLNPHIVNETMKKEGIQCQICIEELNVGEKYSVWPCESQIPHMFHFECMLNLLRTNNQCPLCRRPAK